MLSHCASRQDDFLFCFNVKGAQGTPNLISVQVLGNPLSICHFPGLNSTSSCYKPSRGIYTGT